MGKTKTEQRVEELEKTIKDMKLAYSKDTDMYCLATSELKGIKQTRLEALNEMIDFLEKEMMFVNFTDEALIISTKLEKLKEEKKRLESKQ